MGIFISFYVLIIDYGPYSILILPLFYILFTYLLEGLPKYCFYVTFFSLLVFNGGYTVLKAAQIVNSIELRDYRRIDSFISKSIPKGSKVVGDVVLYYSVEKTGSTYQYIDHPGNDIKIRESKLIKEFSFDYLILSDQFVERSTIDAQYLIRSGRYERLDRFEKKTGELAIRLPLLEKLSNLENANGYNCTVYKRIK